jgi:hypothetical protein
MDVVYPNGIEVCLIEESEDLEFSSASLASPVSVKCKFISWLSNGAGSGGEIIIIDKDDIKNREHIFIKSFLTYPSNPLKYGNILIINTVDLVYFYKIVIQ